jgi:hypothetical protein
MTDGSRNPNQSEWDWILETGFDIGGSVMFIRGAKPEQVIEAHGMDLTEARLLPASRADEAIRLPVHDDECHAIHPWIRAGQTGEWAFALDVSAGGYAGYEDDVARELSRGTDAVWFAHTQTIDTFQYFVDGVTVTQFEPLLANDRFGSDPDRFLRQMRQAGLDPDPLPDHAPAPDAITDPRVALLKMLTLALGIRLPEEVALGPLLTVQRSSV